MFIKSIQPNQQETISGWYWHSIFEKEGKAPYQVHMFLLETSSNFHLLQPLQQIESTSTFVWWSDGRSN